MSTPRSESHGQWHGRNLNSKVNIWVLKTGLMEALTSDRPFISQIYLLLVDANTTSGTYTPDFLSLTPCPVKLFLHLNFNSTLVPFALLSHPPY
jgi:hypothetical protein